MKKKVGNSLQIYFRTARMFLLLLNKRHSCIYYGLIYNKKNKWKTYNNLQLSTIMKRKAHLCIFNSIQFILEVDV